MARSWPHVPGVPAAGHVTQAGQWHQGAAGTCRRCQPPEPVPCGMCGRDCGRWYYGMRAPFCPACWGPPRTRPHGPVRRETAEWMRRRGHRW